MNGRSALLAEIVGGAVATAVAPAVLAYAAVRPGFASTLPERCGRGSWHHIQRRRELIWLHGASVGEIEGVRPIAARLRELGFGDRLLITTTSVTGRDAALRDGLAPNVGLFPFDHPCLVGRLMDGLAPRAAIFFETELWPNTLLALRRRNVPVLLVNGRISDQSIRSYRCVRAFLRKPLATFRTILTQGELDRLRFIDIGARPSAVRVSGSTKYDRPSDEPFALEQFASQIGLRREHPCFVAGSVRPGEEEQVVDAYAQVSTSEPALQCVIAPRHPDRFDAVARLLSSREILFNRRSQGGTFGEASVLLLDTLGELRLAYGLATAAFVGGTLVPIGGHNPLEPAPFRVPVIVGPHTHNIHDAMNLLREHGGVVEVEDESDLSRAILRLVREVPERETIGRGAQEAWRSQLGATDRAMEVLLPLLEGGGR